MNLHELAYMVPEWMYIRCAVISKSSNTSETRRNKCKLSITTLVSGIVGNRGALDTLNCFDRESCELDTKVHSIYVNTVQFFNFCSDVTQAALFAKLDYH